MSRADESDETRRSIVSADRPTSVGHALWWMMGELDRAGWSIKTIQIAVTGSTYLTATKHQARLTIRVADHRTRNGPWFRPGRRKHLKLQLLAHRPTSFEHVATWLDKFSRHASGDAWPWTRTC